jgi:hypothetical protein
MPPVGWCFRAWDHLRALAHLSSKQLEASGGRASSLYVLGNRMGGTPLPDAIGL